MADGRAPAGAGPGRSRARRAVRRSAQALAALLAAYLGALAFGMPPAVPFDLLVNLGGVEVDPALRAPADGRRRLVVLQHGLWRSAWSLWRLQRALVAHGYEVFDPGYPSTRERIEQHASRLQRALDGWQQVHGPVDDTCFVGHSMGGLVIQEYLRLDGALRPAACVFVATPHRGAVLCDLRKNWWLFRLFMGGQAALQLSPGDPLHGRLLPLPCPFGTIAGDLGECHTGIPGPDDGTVGVDEAAREGAADAIVLPHGHTAIAAAPATIRQVLHFLRWGRFAH